MQTLLQDDADDVPHSLEVALITDGTWRRRFGASTDVLGKHVLVDGISREIIGVLLPARRASLVDPIEALRSE